MKKKLFSLMLVFIMALVPVTSVPVMAENITETLTDGTVIHHIDISSKYNYDTIGGVGDTVNSGAAWGGFTSASSPALSTTAPGYPDSLSYFTKDADGNPTGDLVMKKVVRDEENAPTGFSDTDTFTFKVPKEGLSGDVNDGLVIKASTTTYTINLEPIRTSSVKMAISNVQGKDWTEVKAVITYENGDTTAYRGHQLTGASSGTYENSPYAGYSYVSTARELKDTTIYDSGTRGFARALEAYKSVTPTVAEDSTYTLQEDETEFTVRGFRGIEFDTDPTKVIKSITLRNGRTNDTTRFYTLYAVAQVEATDEDVKNNITGRLSSVDVSALLPDSEGGFTEEQQTKLAELNSLIESYVDLGGNYSDYPELVEVIKAYNQQYDYYVNLNNDVNAEIFVPGWSASGSECFILPESYTSRANNMFATKRLASYLDSDGYISNSTTGNKYKFSENSMILGDEGFGNDVVKVSEGNTYIVNVPNQYQGKMESLNVVATRWDSTSSYLSGITVPVTVSYSDGTSEEKSLYVAPARSGSAFSAEQKAKRVGGTNNYGNLYVRNLDTGTWYTDGDTSTNLAYMNNSSKNLNWLFEYVIPITSEKDVASVTFGLNSSNSPYYIAAVTLNKFPTIAQICSDINAAADSETLAEILETYEETIGIDFSKYAVTQEAIDTALITDTDFTGIDEVVTAYNTAYDNKTAEILADINSAASADIITKLDTHAAAGVMSNSKCGAYIYQNMKDEMKSDVGAKLLELRGENGFETFDLFIEAYDKAVNYALSNLIAKPDANIDFNDKTASDASGNEKHGTLYGSPEFTEGPDGTNALKITNDFGKTAQQYLDMGEYDFSAESFSIVFWMKAPERGISGFEESADQIAADATVDFSAYTGSKGGVVFSNKDYSTPDNTGFAVSAMPVYADLAYNMKLGENDTVNADGIQTAVDSRWHQISYIVNRDKNATLYVDSTVVSETDISALEGSLGAGKLIFGADGLGQYGMMKGEFDNIKVYSCSFEADRVEELYYINLLNNINSEISRLLSSENASVYSEENINALKAELEKSQLFMTDYEVGNTALLTEQYNAINDYYNNFLNKDVNATALFVSDVHINRANPEFESAVSLKKALTESTAWENPVDTYIMSGDLTQLASDHFDYFYGFMYDWRPENTNLAICRGNHDNWVSTNEERVYSSLSAIRNSFYDFMDTFVDKENAFNADCLDSDGNVKAPYYYTTDGAAHYLSLDAYYPLDGSVQIGDTQINWLDKTIEQISGDGKPIFVIEHLPLRETTSGWSYLGLSEDDDAKLKAVLKKYKNVFVLNGHSHHGMGSGSGTPFYGDGFIQINGPVLCNQAMARGYDAGSGYYINIYDDRVVFRARDIENGIWLREYDMTFMLGATDEDEKSDIADQLSSVDVSALLPDSEGGFTEEQQTKLAELNSLIESYVDLGGNYSDYPELMEVIKAYNQQFDYYVNLNNDVNAEIFVPGWTTSGSECFVIPESYTSRANNMFATKRLASYLDSDGYISNSTTGNKYKFSENSVILGDEGFGNDIVKVSEGNTYTVNVSEQYQGKLESLNVVATKWDSASSSISGITVPVTVTYSDGTSEEKSLYAAPARSGSGFSAAQKAKRVGGTNNYGNLYVRNLDTGTWYADGDTSTNLAYTNNSSKNQNWLFEYVIPITSEKDVASVTFGLDSSNSDYYIAAVTLKKFPTASKIADMINNAADETELAEILEVYENEMGIDFAKYSIAKAEINAALLTETNFESLEAIVSAYNTAYDNAETAIITAVSSADDTTIDELLADLSTRGIITDYANYEKLTEAGKAEVKSRFIEGGKTVTLLSEIVTVWSEAMNLPKITVELKPQNYAIAFIDTKPAYNKTVDLTNVKTYVNNWHEPQLYNKSVITEFYLPLKEFLTDVSANYSYVTEKNEGNFAVRYGFCEIPDSYTVTDKDGIEQTVSLDKSTPASYHKQYDVTTETTDEESGETTSATETVYPDTYLKFKAWEEWVTDNLWSNGSFSKLFTISTPTNKVSTITDNSYSFTSEQLEALKTAESKYFTMGNTQGNYYARYKLKEIPSLTLTYLSADILNYINTATADDMTEKLTNLGKAGVLTLSVKGAQIYDGMNGNVKGVINEKLIELRQTGFASVADFVSAYDKAIDYAVNDILNKPEVYISFDDETAADISGNGRNGTLNGAVTFVTGIDGTKALRVDNEYGKTAQQYLNLGEYDFSQSNFSIVFNMKAPDRGVNYGGSYSYENTLDFSQYDGTYGGGVAISNKDFNTPDNEGFAMAAISANSDFTYNLKIGENDVVQENTITTPVDSRWHQIVYSVNRQGTADIYVDGVLTVSTDISKLAGDFGSGNLVFGADGLGQYGMTRGEFDDIKVYYSAITESQVSELYYKYELKNIISDMESLINDDGKSVYSASVFSEANIAELQAELADAKQFYDSYVSGGVEELKAYYTELNDYYNVFLNRDALKVAMFTSDIHIAEANETHQAALNLKTALTESSTWEHPVDTFIMSGDLAHIGLTLGETFRGIVTDYLPVDAQLAVCRGNHENWIATNGTPATDAELPGLISDWTAFLNSGIVDKTHPLNKSILDENGDVSSPWYYLTDGAAHYIMVDMYTVVVRYAPYHITDEQVEWLDSTLDAVSGDGKPIFIVIHNPLRNTVSHWDYGPIGEEDDAKIKAALKGHDNLIVLNGHLHFGMGSGTGTPYYDTETGFVQVNGPSLGKGEGYGYNGATGYYINIYDDRVVFRARDVEKGTWLRGYDFSVMLEAAEEAEMTLGEITVSDAETTYGTVAEAAGKTVKVTVPVTNAAAGTAILAEYNGQKFENVTVESVLQTDTEITFNVTLSENTTKISVMVFDSLQGMKPLCEAVNK